MPELHTHYPIKEIADMKDFITAAFVIIDDLYQSIAPTHIKNRRNIETALLHDSEIITISIVGELLTIDSEKAWLGFCRRNFSDLFPHFCHRTRFNRTRRGLFQIIELIRAEITKELGYLSDPLRIVDSIPVKVCEFGRAHFHKTFREQAAYSKNPSKKETYLGFKLHMLSTSDGYITDYAITAANIDDRVAIWDLVAPYSGLTILGDKGYIGAKLAEELNGEKSICFLPLRRDNDEQQYEKRQRQIIFRQRRRIETTASQLAGQLNIERVLAKSLWGFITRVITKLLAHSIGYFINAAMGKTNRALIKGLIFG